MLIDGVDVRDYELHALREQIGFVLQETVLFRGTIRDNIAYGRPGRDGRGDRRGGASSPTRDEFIAKMPKGYDTVVGERGDTLSGGQRQRIGIARAVIRDNADPDPRRADRGARHRVGAARDGGPRAADEGPHGDHHRAPPVDIRDADKIIVLDRTASSPSRARTTSSSRRDGIYAELYHVQFGDGRRPPADLDRRPCPRIAHRTSRRHRQADRSTRSRRQEDAARQDVRVHRPGPARRGASPPRSAASTCA